MHQSWIWLIVAFVFGLWLWGFVQQVLIGQPWGNNPMSDLGVTFIGLVPISIGTLLWSVKLKFKIDDTGIHWSYFPFVPKTQLIRQEDIQKIEVRKFSPIGEYLGWGVRMSLKGNGWCYTTDGSFGLQINQKGGKKILLGTQKPDELRNYLANRNSPN